MFPETREEYTQFALDPASYLQGQKWRDIFEWIKTTYSMYSDLLTVREISRQESGLTYNSHDRIGYYCVRVAGYQVCQVRQNDIYHALYDVIQAKLEDEHALCLLKETREHT